MNAASFKFIVRTIIFSVTSSVVAVLGLYVAALLGYRAEVTELLAGVLSRQSLLSTSLSDGAKPLAGSLEMMLVDAALLIAFFLTLLIYSVMVTFRRLMAAPRGGEYE